MKSNLFITLSFINKGITFCYKTQQYVIYLQINYNFKIKMKEFKTDSFNQGELSALFLLEASNGNK